jgi:hypothetical protein
VFPNTLGNTVAIRKFPQIYGFYCGGFFVVFFFFFFTFSLNEGNITPYSKSVASALRSHEHSIGEMNEI